jgi:ribosomal protein L37AE/L43A
MSTLRKLFSESPETCPICGFVGIFAHVDGKNVCRRCRSLIDDNQTVKDTAAGDDVVSDAELNFLFGTPPEKPAPPKTWQTPSGRDLSMYRPTYRLTHRGELPAFADAVFSTAMGCISQRQYDESIKALYRCLEYLPDFTDAHLWLGRLLDNPDERRKHLREVLAIDLNHLEATHELMILEGDLAPDHRMDAFTMPTVRQADAVVNTDTTTPLCPQCGSPRLSDDDGESVWICESCGTRVEHAERSLGTVTSLTRAMLKRRAQPVVWVVGERLLTCGRCAAQRTVSAEVLASDCPFCGSTQVVLQDALNTLTQPEGIVPFKLSRKLALESINAALETRFERVKGWLSDNRVSRVVIEGVFLPYWVFDVSTQVTRTYIVSKHGDRNAVLSNSMAMTETLQDAVLDLMVPGVKQPAPELLERLGKFDLSEAVIYQPEAIAQHSAELYTRDFDRAALDAHSRVSDLMRERHSRQVSNFEQTLGVSSLIKSMGFRLLLLPVWAAVLMERDGDVRPAVVNGQTGRVVLGRTQKY